MIFELIFVFLLGRWLGKKENMPYEPTEEEKDANYDGYVNYNGKRYGYTYEGERVNKLI